MVSCGIMKKKYLVLLIFTVLYILLLFGLRIPESSDKFLRFFLDNSVLLFLTYFLSGVVFYLFRDSIPSHRFLFITIFFVTLLAAVFGILHQVIPLTLPYIIFYLASVLPFSGVTRYGDFSYGIYIYAFPMQQLLTHFQLNQSFLIYAVLSVLGTVGFAVLSWYVVERPALYFKRVSFSELIVAIYRYFFFPKRPRTVPDKTAKSAANWSNGKKKKARTSLT